MEVTAEKAIVNYINMNITALTEKEEESLLNFLETEVIVKPKIIARPEGLYGEEGE